MGGPLPASVQLSRRGSGLLEQRIKTTSQVISILIGKGNYFVFIAWSLSAANPQSS
jgi:hypothetical protein